MQSRRRCNIMYARCARIWHRKARWPSGLRRNVKVSLIHKLKASVVFGRGFESHSCHNFAKSLVLISVRPFCHVDAMARKESSAFIPEASLP